MARTPNNDPSAYAGRGTDYQLGIICGFLGDIVDDIEDRKKRGGTGGSSGAAPADMSFMGGLVLLIREGANILGAAKGISKLASAINKFNSIGKNGIDTFVDFMQKVFGVLDKFRNMKELDKVSKVIKQVNRLMWSVVGITAILVVLAIIDWKLAIGALVGLAAVAVLVAGFFKLVLAVFPKKKMDDVSKSLAAMTDAFLKIGLMMLIVVAVSTLFNWAQIIKGLALMAGVILLTAGMFWLISKVASKDNMKGVDEALMNIAGVMYMMTFNLLLMSLITVLFPWKVIRKSLMIMGGFAVGMLALLLAVAAIEKHVGKGEDSATKTLIQLGVVLGIFILDIGLMSLMVLLFGMETLVKAGLMMVAFLGINMIAMTILSRMKPAKATETAVGVGIMLLSLIAGFVVLLFVADHFDWRTELEAGIMLVAFLGIAVLATMILNRSLKEKDVSKATSAAVAVSLLLGAVLIAALGFIGLSILIDKSGVTGKGMAIAGAIIGGMVLSTIGIMWALGKVDMASMGKSMLVIAGLSLFLGALEALAFGYVWLAKYIDKAVEGRAGEERSAFFAAPGILMASLIGGISLVVLALGALMLIPALPAVLGAGMAVTAGIALLMGGLIALTRSFIDVVALINKHGITGDTVDMFLGIVGNGTDGRGLLGAMGIIIKNIGAMDTGDLGGWFKAKMVLNSLGQLMGVVGKFMDIVLRYANFQYITGYDDKGNPVYGKFSDGQFTSAAEAISEGFGTFLVWMNASLGELAPVIDGIGIWFMHKLSALVGIVGKFTNIVLDLTKSTFIVGYDDNGKPVYERVTAADFTAAAAAVSEGFASFLTELQGPLDDIEDIIDDIGLWFTKKLGSVVGVVSKFTDIVLNFITSTIPDLDPQRHPGEDLYKEDGTPRFYRQISPDDFIKSADAVTESFMTFLTKLKENLQSKETRNTIEDAIEALEDISPVLEAASNLAKAILDISSLHPYLTDENGNVLYLAGKDGNPDYTKPRLDYSKEFDAAGAAANVAGMFTTFLSVMSSKFSSESFKDNLEDMMDYFSDGDFGKMLKNLASMSSMMMNVVKTISADTEDSRVYEMMSDLNESGLPKAVHAFLKSMVSTLASFSADSVISSVAKISSMGDSMKSAAQALSGFMDLVVGMFVKFDKAKRERELESFDSLCADMVRGISKFADDAMLHATENFSKSAQLLASAVDNINAFSAKAEQALQSFQRMKPLSENFASTSKLVCDAISSFSNDYIAAAAQGISASASDLVSASNNLSAFTKTLSAVFDSFGQMGGGPGMTKFDGLCKGLIGGVMRFSDAKVMEGIRSFKLGTGSMVAAAADLQSFTDVVFDVFEKFENEDTGVGNFDQVCKKLAYGIQQFATVAMPENELAIASALQAYEKDLKRFTDSNKAMSDSLGESTRNVKDFSNSIKDLHQTLAVQGEQIGAMMTKATESMKQMILQMSYMIGGIKNIANADFDNTTSSLRTIKDDLVEILTKMNESGMNGQGAGSDSVSADYGDYGEPGSTQDGASSSVSAQGGAFGTGAGIGYAGGYVGGGSNGDVVIAGISPTAINQIKRALGK